MAVEFKLTRKVPQDRPNVAVLHLSGWLDAQAEDQLVAAVQKARDMGAEYVLLELGGITTITSAGIRGIQKSFAIMTPKAGRSPAASSFAAHRRRSTRCSASPAS